MERQLLGYEDKTFEMLSLVDVMLRLVLKLVLVMSVIAFCHCKFVSFVLKQHSYMVVDLSAPFTA